MITKKIPSAVPYYTTGAVWLIYACFFSMYRWYDFLGVAVLSAAVFTLMRKLFPGTEIRVEEPVNTGYEELDEVIVRGREAIRQMRNLNEQIENAYISRQIDEMERTSMQIFQFLKREPDKIPGVRTFMNYYLPTGIKLLENYQILSGQGTNGANITGTMKKIEDVIGTVVSAFHKELDNLFEGRAIDIAAEIRTLNTMMNNHGLNINHKNEEEI